MNDATSPKLEIVPVHGLVRSAGTGAPRFDDCANTPKEIKLLLKLEDILNLDYEQIEQLGLVPVYKAIKEVLD